MINYTINTVKFLTGNRILNIAIIACLVAQILKVIISLICEKRLRWDRMFETGGMPSSHSALVVALATGVGRILGTNSPEFAIAVCFAIIVMYDAAGVRRAAGNQARVLNYIMENWRDSTPEMFEEKLRELLGHTPIQVIAGAILGFVMGFFFV